MRVGRNFCIICVNKLFHTLSQQHYCNSNSHKLTEVETMERALRRGNADLQADNTCRPGITVQHVEAGDRVSPSSAAAGVHVATAAASESTGLTMGLLRELLAKIRHLQQ